MRIENWCGHDIRFVEIDGHWYAILKDICDALHLRTAKIAERLDPSMLERVLVDTSDVLSKDLRYEPVKKLNKATSGKTSSATWTRRSKIYPRRLEAHCARR